MKTTFTGSVHFYFSVTMFAVFASFMSAHGQSKALPYKTGWDNATDKAEWKLYQLKSKDYYQWSMPGNMNHDYPVGNTNADSVEDWAVSPPLNITGKSRISFSANIYVIFQQRPSDYFGIWYSTKSSDPKSGDFKELADFTSWASNNFSYWHDTSDVTLNDSGSAVYIAFKYKETNNWFTIAVDTFEIRPVHTSGVETPALQINAPITVYPNPSNGKFSLRLPENMSGIDNEVNIYDMCGKLLIHTPTFGKTDLIFNTENPGRGVYQVQVSGKTGLVFNGKIVVN